MMTEEKRDASEIPDPEVRVTPQSRQFNNEYKLEVLRRADACTQPGEGEADGPRMVGGGTGPSE